MLEAKLPHIKQGNYALWMLNYQDRHVQSVKSGENAGKTLTSVNPVSNIVSIGLWEGEELSLPLNPDTDEQDGIVVIAQDVQTGYIVASGRLQF